MNREQSHFQRTKNEPQSTPHYQEDWQEDLLQSMWETYEDRELEKIDMDEIILSSSYGIHFD